MPGPLILFFDFASPYAYVAFDATAALAAEAGRTLVLRPVLTWAVLEAQGIPAPFASPVRTRYLLGDMARSAAFHGLPWNPPLPLPVSAHRAARMWLGLSGRADAGGLALARAIYAARFRDGLDIRDADLLARLAAALGHDPAAARAAMEAPGNRAALEAAIADAVAGGAPGVPWLSLDGEGFFGADRLAQLRWRLGLPPAPPPTPTPPPTPPRSPGAPATPR